MEKNLKKSIEEFCIFSSYPIQFLENNTIENDNEAESALYNIVKLLHSIDSDEIKLKKFYENIDKDDFFKIKMFLTERLYCLRKK
jgi:hypothetical protein